MKKTSFLRLMAATLCIAALAACSSENDEKVITLNLNKANLTFDENGLWDGTYSTEAGSLDVQLFSFDHEAGEYNGTPWWMGFTASKESTGEANYTGCVAKGGVDGVGTPYVTMSMLSSNVIFNDEKAHVVKGLYVCNQTGTYASITDENGFGPARPFKKGDYCTLTINGLDEDYSPVGDGVVWYVADYRSDNPEDWTVNNAWEWIDLEQLGAVYGLSFTMYSTDGYEYQGTYYFNT
ncbi:MAG: DUF4465 domain-containing protein, partial [Paludibacteraceae bacterium]|nr:DUF4465 domain-containing protein [Paludibacteraceae bacterium]